MKGLNLRGKSAVVMHPSDDDADELLRQLGRIGLVTYKSGEKEISGIGKVDFVFCDYHHQNNLTDLKELPFSGPRTVWIVMIDSESPTILNEILCWDDFLVKPIKPFGLLATLTFSAARKRVYVENMKKVNYLESKIAGFREVEKAKEFLMFYYNISGEDAFRMIRRNAMDQRRSIEAFAREVNKARVILSSASKKRTKENSNVLNFSKKDREVPGDK